MRESISGSFRDPSGFLFVENGELFRQINLSYASDYDALMTSGLYKLLVNKDYLIAHEEITDIEKNGATYKIIKPEKVPVISYPYEWSFSQLKDAALLTLEIQRLALAKNMSLKDASAYNVQFHQGHAIFIDTLSFEQVKENQPWVAYRQFCQHFLAPLALMAKTDVSLNQLFCTNIDGVPLELASRLLPWATKLSFGLGIHIHLHAKTQHQNADKAVAKKQIKGSFSKNAFFALIDNLKSAISSLEWKPKGTEWHDYYSQNNNYMNDSLAQKDALVEKFMCRVSANITWDFGANTGRFSRIAAKHSKTVCAWDIDPACVEINYRETKTKSEKNIVPLLLNLINPSPAIGWHNNERMSLAERAPVDMILALGLVHHLAISNNVPLDRIAFYFQSLTAHLMIEFVPKNDSQVQKLLSSREDVFPLYDQENFERIFNGYFEIINKELIPDTQRTLYLFKALSPQTLQ